MPEQSAQPSEIVKMVCWCRKVILWLWRKHCRHWRKIAACCRPWVNVEDSWWNVNMKWGAARRIFAARCRKPMPDQTQPQSAAGGTIAYILKGFPRLSETFITSEIYRMEQLGLKLKLYVIKPSEGDVSRAGIVQHLVANDPRVVG